MTDPEGTQPPLLDARKQNKRTCDYITEGGIESVKGGGSPTKERNRFDWEYCGRPVDVYFAAREKNDSSETSGSRRREKNANSPHAHGADLSLA